MAGLITDALPVASGVLRWLAGSWSLLRSIDNGASLVGTALFVDQGGGRFAYTEHGELTLADGHRLEAERRYLFQETDTGFIVWFPETPPRLFHRIAVRRNGLFLMGAAGHVCGDDHYVSRYEFRTDGSFSVRHAVAGPRKDYTIETYYTRDAR